MNFSFLWFDSVDFTLFFLLFEFTYYSRQFYLLICFLLKLPYVSFLSTITVTKELDSRNKNSYFHATFDFYFPYSSQGQSNGTEGRGLVNTNWGLGPVIKIGTGDGTVKYKLEPEIWTWPGGRKTKIPTNPAFSCLVEKDRC